MSAFTQRITALQDQAQDALADMKPRDRHLFIGLVAFVLLGLVFGSIWWMRGSLSELEGKVADRSHTLRQIEIMAADHAETEAELESLSKQLAQQGSQDVSSFPRVLPWCRR